MADREWQHISTAPKDGTLIALCIAPTPGRTNALDDTMDYTQTIGFNQLEHTTEDRWEFAGWDWCGDQFTEGHGTPVFWHALLDLPAFLRNGKS